MKRHAAALAAAVFVCSCSVPTPAPGPSEVPAVGEVLPVLPGSAPAVLVGTGDIAICGSSGSELTARLLDRIGGTVFTTGDNAYPHGTAEQYRDCYGPTWGRHRHRTRPTPGNHEYDTAAAAPYFQYFGANAGPPGRGYYGYRVGTWLVLSLNSEIDARAGSEQERWLRGVLTANPTICTAAYWHRPVFSSGPHGPNPAMRDIWRTLHEFGAEVVMTGHDHLYERFEPQDAWGSPDEERGIRHFVLGTGGARIYTPRRVSANSAVIGTDLGVLVLTLQQGGYLWEFVPVAGATFRDSGSGVCH